MPIIHSEKIKVADQPEKYDFDADNYPKLESNDDPVIYSSPTATQDNKMNALRTILRSVRAENISLKKYPQDNIIDALRTILKFVRAENYALKNNDAYMDIMQLQHIAASRADQIDGLLQELDVCKHYNSKLQSEIIGLNKNMTDAVNDKKRYDAAIFLQDMASKYLANKREMSEWIFPKGNDFLVE